MNTYLGGSGGENVKGNDGSREAALDFQGNYLCAGDTTSRGFPLRNALDSGLSGANDGFVARFLSNRVVSDPNADGIVDFKDFSLLAEDWLKLNDEFRMNSPAAEP